MKIGIIADSCCDCTPQLKNVLGLQLAPLKITVPGFGEVIDDENIDTKKLVANMKECKTASSSSCPSPEDYAELMRKSEACFVVTLSSKLSGSYQSAIIAKQLVQEQEPNKKVHIVDSESAACGEFRLALALRSWIDEGLDFEKIQENITDLVAKMRTLFVLEDLGNLVKNGRISKAAGLLGGMLGLRPIMGENGHGEIVCLEKIRGTEKALAKLVDTIGDFL
ncbi:MAG: DegV family protein, partial [Oscillospiraceae bacterium]